MWRLPEQWSQLKGCFRSVAIANVLACYWKRTSICQVCWRTWILRGLYLGYLLRGTKGAFKTSRF